VKACGVVPCTLYIGTTVNCVFDLVFTYLSCYSYCYYCHSKIFSYVTQYRIMNRKFIGPLLLSKVKFHLFIQVFKGKCEGYFKESTVVLPGGEFKF